MVFAAMLRRLRERERMPNPHGAGWVMLSQNQLAQSAQVDPAYVHHLESGKRRSASRAVVLRLAVALDLSRAETDELLVAAGYCPDLLLALDPERRIALFERLAQVKSIGQRKNIKTSDMMRRTGGD